MTRTPSSAEPSLSRKELRQAGGAVRALCEDGGLHGGCGAQAPGRAAYSSICRRVGVDLMRGMVVRPRPERSNGLGCGKAEADGDAALRRQRLAKWYRPRELRAVPRDGVWDRHLAR